MKFAIVIYFKKNVILCYSLDHGSRGLDEIFPLNIEEGRGNEKALIQNHSYQFNEGIERGFAPLKI
jgi:hypothetical protein